jgi:hypothetical protein
MEMPSPSAMAWLNLRAFTQTPIGCQTVFSSRKFAIS